MMFSLSFVGGSISANGFGPGGPNPLGQQRWVSIDSHFALIYDAERKNLR